MKKKCSGTEIVSKLRQADVLIAQGKTVPDVCREIGVTSQTYYRWRYKSCTKYGITVGEILLQRTKAETVAFFYRQFIKKFSSWSVLSKAREKDLQTFLKPLGLWRQRAAIMKKFALEMTKRNGRFPRIRQDYRD